MTNPKVDGPPLPIAAAYSATTPVFDTDQHGVLQMDASGNLKTTGGSGATFAEPDEYAPNGSTGYSVTATETIFTLTAAQQMGYKSVTVQQLANAAGNIWVAEVSNDGGTTWTFIGGYSSDTTVSTYANFGETNARAFTFPLLGGMFRCRCSNYIGGTLTLIPVLRTASAQAAAVVASQTGTWNVVPNGNPAAYTTETNSSIATGGTAQNAVASNSTRKRLKFQNQSTGDMYVYTGGTAANGTGLWLPAGSFYEWPAHDIPTGALSVWGATTGQAYYVAQG